jgi:predicted Zn-dependent peptidase
MRCVLLFLLPLSVLADMDVQTRRLANGLRLITIYNPGSKSESIFTFLPLGLASDGPGQTQWSHLVEHLVVSSTTSDLEHFNAETLSDHIRLDSYGTVENWRDLLDHHRRWLEGVPFTAGNLKAEKPRVVGETDYTATNSYTHKFALAAWAQAVRHSRTIVAVRADPRAASVEAIQRYRDEHLVVLDRAVVCFVGGVEPESAFASAGKALEGIRSHARAVAPVELHGGSDEITWDLDARHLLWTWPIPSVDHEDYAALFVAAQLLTMRFYNNPRLKALTGLSLAGADLSTPEGMYFFLSASLKPAAAPDEVRRAIENDLKLLSGEGADMAALIGPQLGFPLLHLTGPATTAMEEGNLGLRRGMAEFRLGSNLAAVSDRLVAMDAAKVRKAAVRYLPLERGSAYNIMPKR